MFEDLKESAVLSITKIISESRTKEWQENAWKQRISADKLAAITIFRMLMETPAVSPGQPVGAIPDRATVLNLDVSADEARALHRVVRAMHDGHCPKCGCVSPAELFRLESSQVYMCPACSFTITFEQVSDAMLAFRPYMQASAEIFEKWAHGGYDPTKVHSPEVLK